MKIESFNIESHEAIELLSLLKSEWHDIDNFEREKFGVKIPDPLISLENGQLVGGLSFTSYKNPLGDDIVIWINAVFVIHKYRKMGIASKLIQTAMGVTTELFALTDIPELYTKLGWKLVLKDENGAIVKCLNCSKRVQKFHCL